MAKTFLLLLYFVCLRTEVSIYLFFNNWLVVWWSFGSQITLLIFFLTSWHFWHARGKINLPYLEESFEKPYLNRFSLSEDSCHFCFPYLLGIQGWKGLLLNLFYHSIFVAHMVDICWLYGICVMQTPVTRVFWTAMSCNSKHIKRLK